MQAEIISIGDEITSGQLLDTNAQWLSLRLEEIGIRVLYHTTVGDELESVAGVFRQAIKRAGVVVVTGGLGPTEDDLTREALARATGRELQLNQQALEQIESLYARRRRVMPQRNRRQALIPAGGRPIHNPHGTAPGILMEIHHPCEHPCRVFVFPGVPAEMRQMWCETVVAMLQETAPGRVIRHRKIKCFGAGESNIEEMLPDLIRRGRTPRVGINASKNTIILRITAQGATEAECEAAIEPTVATIRGCLGNLVFGEGDDELQHAVARLLAGQCKTLATAEWGTGGLVADWMAETAQSHEHFLGGVTVVNESSLGRVLDVSLELLARHSPTSVQVVSAMARNCRQKFGADFGLSVSRFPEFDPSAAEPNDMFIALATEDDVTVKAFPYAGHPATLKIFSAKRALNVLRLAMLG